MIQVVLEGLNDNLEEEDRRNEVQTTVLHHFAMTGRPVSLETDGFPNNKIAVILDNACTHILFNNPGHFVDLSFQINKHVILGDASQVPVRGICTVNLWYTDSTPHPYQLKDWLYVPDLKYSVVGEDALYANGFRRSTLFYDRQIPYIECVDEVVPYKALTSNWGKLHVFSSWAFHPTKRNEFNWREMRNDTRVLSARSYLPFAIRQNKLLLETPTLGTENSAHMYRLRVMADSLITVDYPKPLYLREISPELSVQRTSY